MRSKCYFLLAIAIILGCLLGLRQLGQINTGQVVEIFVLAVLVCATAWYVQHTKDIADATKEQAKATREQAEASVKMAEEMREQRYDTLRPIIDILGQRVEPIEMARQAYGAKEGEFPKGLPCILRNIGVGPAIEVYSFIEDAKGETCRWDFGSIPVAIGAEEMGYTREMSLSLRQRGEHKALVAYYKDVYDNPFESSREVCLDSEKSTLKIGPLKIRSLPKEE